MPEPPYSEITPEVYPAEPQRSFTGYSRINLTSGAAHTVNEFLQNEGYPTLDQRSSGRGGGGLLITSGKTIVDVGGSGGGGRGEGESFISEGGIGSGSLAFGRVLLNLGGLRVYPLIGIGGVGGGVEVRRTSDPDGDPVYQVAGASPVFSIGLGLDLRLKIWRMQAMLGLRVGLRIPSVQFKGSDGQKAGQPVGGFFLEFVGGSGFNRNQLPAER